MAKTLTGKDTDVYLYKFTRVPDTKSAKLMGAYHSIEMNYVFGGLEHKEGYDDTDFKLSRTIMDYWVNFAKTKNPNGKGLPEWKLYDDKSDSYMELGDKVEMVKNPDSDLFSKIRKIQEKMNYQ